MSVYFRLPIIMVLSACLLCLTAGAAMCDDSVEKLGNDLLQKLWKDSKAGNETAMANWLAKGFQSMHQDGARNRDQEIKLLKNVNLGDYKLTDIKVTGDGPVIVTTYFVSVPETIEGKRTKGEPSGRMTVFLKTDAGWKWMAHAHLQPPGGGNKTHK